MPRIQQRDIEELRNGALEAVAASYTRLKRAGSRMVGLCPVHAENTPSFTVERSTNLYYCFGCNSGGDVFTLVEAVDGVRFYDAVERVAQIVGHQLTYEEESEEQKARRAKRTRAVEANTAAADLFRDGLYGQHGGPALAYLHGRGFDDDDIRRFGVGYCPNPDGKANWMVARLSNDGLAVDEMADAGLTRRTDRGITDFFSGRLIFPIRDASGAAIAFAGRRLTDDDAAGPKYVNTPETDAYHKSRVLFGLDLARAQVAKRDWAVLVEGYTDVMAMHKVGLDVAVATCGTAAGDEHLKLLGRYARKVVLAFDGDAAGAKAIERAWEAAQPYGVDVRVAELPAGSDPADVALSDAAGLERTLRDAPRGIDWLIDRDLADHDLANPHERAEAVGKVVSRLAQVRDDVLRGMLVRPVADRVRVDPSEIHRQATAAGVDLTGTPAQAAPARTPASGDVGVNIRKRVEAAVLWAAVHEPGWLPPEWYDEPVTGDHFEFDTSRHAFAAVMAAGGPGSSTADAVGRADDPAARSLLSKIATSDAPIEAADAAAVRESVAALIRARLDRDRARIKREMALHPSGSAEQLSLVRESTALSRRMHDMRNPTPH